jgi:cell division protease FtsH
MDSKSKSIVFYGVLVCVAVLMWAVMRNQHSSANANYSDLLQQVQSGQVSSAIIVAGHTVTDRVTYRLKNGNELQTVVPSRYRELLDTLQQNKVNIEIREDAPSQWLRILANSSPFLLLLGFWFYAMRRLSNRVAK